MKLHDILSTLALKRPLFHSEADFKHALAWEIQTHYPDAKIRLEYRPATIDGKMYVDVWVELHSQITAIELKYKTRPLDAGHGGEAFRLLGQGAQDQARYDFLLDVHRLERVVAAYPRSVGAAIFLTNDRGYWVAPRALQSVDAAFRLHEGRSLEGELAWGAAAAAGTKSGRDGSITLAAKYGVAWAEYSTLESNDNGLFRYLLVSIPSAAR